MNIQLFLGFFLFLYGASASSQPNYLVCHGKISEAIVDYGKIPVERSFISERSSAKNYIFNGDRLTNVFNAACQISNESINCKGVQHGYTQESKNVIFVRFNRITGEVTESDFTRINENKETYFDGICMKTAQKF